MKKEQPNSVNLYNNWTRRATAEAAKMQTYRLQCEEFFFSDVQNTLSQFTQNQKNIIDSTYNIPVSTKISYALIEQLLALITSSKPFPRLVSSTDSTKEWTDSLSNGYQGIWYESHANRELKLALRDALVSGSGFLMVRRNGFYNETTFNTVIEYKSWRHIFVDPDSNKEDFSDAEYIGYIDIMPTYKAEKYFDIDINEADVTAIVDGLDQVFGTIMNKQVFPGWDINRVKYVILREIYHKEEINVYVSEEGYVTNKRPEPIEMMNQDKQDLMNQIQEQQSLQQEGIQQQGKEIEATPNPNELRAYGTENEMVENEANIAENNPNQSGTAEQVAQMEQEINQMMLEASQMPDTIPGFRMKLQDGRTVDVKSITKIKKKRIKRVMLVGNKKIEEEYLPIDQYPITHITFCHNANPNKTYGIVHFIQDIVKAMNKFLALSIYDMQTNGQRKVLAPEGAFEESTQFEKTWANPGSLNFWRPNMALPNGGEPKVVEPSPLNQNVNFLMQYFLQIVEYVTGINSLMQGSATDAPQTMGGVQSLQAFGSQRIKSFARSLESSLEHLALNIVGFMQAFAPRNEWIKFFDGNGEEQSVQFLDMPDDLKFKVRVDIVNSLPTQKQLLATLLSSVSGQTKNPLVADALTKVMLKLVENPETDKLAEQIDQMKQLESQNNSLNEELQKEKNRVEMLENQLFNKELAFNIKLATSEALQEVVGAKEKAKAQAQAEGEMGEPGPVHMDDIENIAQEDINNL